MLYELHRGKEELSRFCNGSVIVESSEVVGIFGNIESLDNYMLANVRASVNNEYWVESIELSSESYIGKRDCHYAHYEVVNGAWELVEGD